MYPLLYRDGGNQMTADGGVSVLQGRTLGGSTVINMADVVPIPVPVLTHWKRNFGVSRYSEVRVEEAARICMEEISAGPIGENQLNRNNQILLEGGAKLSLTGGRFQHNRVGCVGSGYCLIGCAYDAKRSVALTFLPKALATGRVLIQTDARVEILETDARGVRAAVGRLVHPHTQEGRASFRVEAEQFILASGAIHTPLVLQASRLGGEAAGKNLSLQPQAPVAATFPEEVKMFRGIPQSAFLDSTESIEADRGLGGFRIEGVAATPGMAAATTMLPSAGMKQFMARYPFAAACLCLVPDRPAGKVTRKKNGRPRIDYPLTPEVGAVMKEAIRTAARVYLQAGAEAVVLPFPGSSLVKKEKDLEQLAYHSVRPAGMPLISAHPQGTCRMGTDPLATVTDLSLKVHGVPNLRILDASVFPTTASSHTMVPVMSFSFLGARDLAETLARRRG